MKIFGPTGMPYIDETIAAEENDPKVHNGTDIYPNILADVEAAIEGLPEKQTEVARPTKTAAKALKAKILMQQGDMTAAKPILADIIANGLSPKGERLALQDDLDANFNATTENGKESIFEVQFSVGANMAGRNGISVMDYAEAISYGGGQNFYLDSKKTAIGKEDYTTAFSVENMAKDVNICMNLAEECGLSMPGEQAAAQVYEKALEQGYGKEDFCATIKVVRG